MLPCYCCGKFDLRDQSALTGTTGSDVLYAGVPVITLPSSRTLGRMGASLLSRVGLSVAITRSEGDFMRTAAALMRNQTA